MFLENQPEYKSSLRLPQRHKTTCSLQLPPTTTIPSGQIKLASHTPKEDILIAGTEAKVSTFRAFAYNEAFVIQKLTIKNRHDVTPGDTDNNIEKITLTYTNKQGKADTKTSYLVDGQAKFTGIDILVPKDQGYGDSYGSGAEFSIIAKANTIAGGVATAGEIIALDVTDFEAVGNDSGYKIIGVKTGAEPNFMHVYSAKPFFSLSDFSPPGPKSLSTEDQVFAFNISNYGTNEIKIEKLVIDIVSSDGSLYPLPSSPPSQPLAVLKDAVTGLVVMGPSSVFLNNTSSGQITFYSQLNKEFVIPKGYARQLRLEVDSKSFIADQPGIDDLVTFSIDYGNSKYGKVTPGNVKWKSDDKSVEWLGWVTNTSLISPTLKY